MFEEKSQAEYDPNSPSLGATTSADEDKNSRHEIDPATQYLRDHPEWADYDHFEANKVRQKIDWRIMPLMVVTNTIGAVDKIIVSNAALYGMIEDTHLVGQQYNWVVSIFYLGWLVAEYPANAILQKFPVGKTVGITVFGWGAVVMCLGAAENAAGLLVLRFLLGVLEAPSYPAFTIINTMWYKKAEQPLRMALALAGFASLIAGGVSYGIGNLHTSIAPWKLLFLVMGAFQLLWGLVLYIWLPDSPLKDNFLSRKEKYIALDRVRENMIGIENKELKWYQVREAFTDYKTYLLVLFVLSIHVPTGGVVAFGAQIVSGLGFSTLETMLLSIPTGVTLTLSSFMVAVPQLWFKNKRCLAMGLCCVVPIVCCTLLQHLPRENKVGRLMAYYFFYFFWGPYATAISLPMGNVSGHTKKLTVNASIFVAYCAANMIGPQVFFIREAPNYPTGYNTLLGFEVAAICCITAYAVGCFMENRRRDRKEGTNVSVGADEQFGDLTDYEKRGFRYLY
ncbi:hypothetical protein CDV31_007410 [Fusarium ambrosium]|uniref:Major facilitator superfamily (MFS) profile domain-containing protein n=1 Tax=Fusarium ambrosium TaxID=131363 RepID=A0A428U720_9HYPO|nr:hypothetical protein CDV31_007410 [Fusarium ambrosium]